MVEVQVFGFRGPESAPCIVRPHRNRSCLKGAGLDRCWCRVCLGLTDRLLFVPVCFCFAVHRRSSCSTICRRCCSACVWPPLSTRRVTWPCSCDACVLLCAPAWRLMSGQSVSLQHLAANSERSGLELCRHGPCGTFLCIRQSACTYVFNMCGGCAMRESMTANTCACAVAPPAASSMCCCLLL